MWVKSNNSFDPKWVPEWAPEHPSLIPQNIGDPVSEKADDALFSPAQVLWVDFDATEQRVSCVSKLQNNTLLHVYTAQTLDEARSHLITQPIEAIIVWQSSLERVRTEILNPRTNPADLPVFVVLEQNHSAAIASAFQGGAQDYFTPDSLQNLEVVAYILQHAAIRYRLKSTEKPPESSEAAPIAAPAQPITQQQSEAFQEQEGGLRAIFDQLLVGLNYTDAEGRHVRVNQQYCKMLGYSPEELLALRYQDITHPDDLAMAQHSAYRQKFAAGEIDTFSLVERLIHKDGFAIWTHITASRVQYGSDRPSLNLAVIQDISEQKRSEQTLAASELRFRRLAANIPGVLFRYVQNPDGTDAMRYISPRSGEVLGVEAEVAMQDVLSLWDVIHPEDVAAVRETLRQSKKTLSIFNVEYREILQDHEVRWIQITSIPEVLEDGVVAWDGFAFDVTKRKLTEQIQQQYLGELKNWRKRYEEAGLVSGQILFEWDVQSNKPTWGKNAEKILGYPPDEMPKFFDEWVNLIHPDDQARFKNEVCFGLEQKGRMCLEYRIRHRDGHYFWVEDKTQMLLDEDANPDRLVGFIGDITVRKRSELALRESELRFRLLSELAPIGIFCADAQGTIVYENPYLQSISGFQEGENVSRSWKHQLHPEDAEAVSQYFQKFIEDQSSWVSEFRLKTADEETLWVLGQATPMRLETGLTGYMGTITDISSQKRSEIVLQHLNERLEQRVADRTDALQQANLKLRIENAIRKHHVYKRQRAEQALNMAKNQLQAVLDAVPGCVAWVGEDLHYLGVNRLMAEIFGRSPEDFVNQKVDFIKNQSVESFSSFFKSFFATCQNSATPKTGSATQELEVVVDKRSIYYLAVAQLYLEGQAAVFVILDITERKQAELEIHRALEKTQELSELKSRFISIASHEFRTPLTTIFSASELLEHYGDRWTLEKKLAYLKQIQESVNHMTGLLNDVLIISAGEAGKLKFEPEVFNIIEFCQTLIEEVKPGSPCKNTINFSYPEAIPPVSLDKKLLRHILSNLLSNAVKYSLAHQPIDFSLTVSATNLIFAIADRGIGIPPEDQVHLFDPFHRAGNVGTISGTGLGLSIVKKAVDLHSGTIDVKSAVGQGSQFTVSLPIQSDHQITGEYQW